MNWTPKVGKWKTVIIRPGKSGLTFVQHFQGWSAGNDEECKLFHNFILYK